MYALVSLAHRTQNKYKTRKRDNMTKVTDKTIKNLNKWREGRVSEKIDLRSIVITDTTHQRTEEINFRGRINKLSYTKNGEPVKLVVRKLKNGKYQLLFGLRQLITAKLMNYKTLSAVITDYGRDELIKYFNKEEVDNIIEYNLDDIKISKDFSNSQPSSRKVKDKIRKVSNGMTELIEVDKDGYLTDGYITYLILKEQGVKVVKVTTDNSVIKTPTVENKYNLTMADVKNLRIADRSKIRKPLFWRNEGIGAWCISENTIKSDEDSLYGTYNDFWIGIFDEDRPKKTKLSVSLSSYGGMCGYNITGFFNENEIENDMDREIQEKLLSKINMLIDEGILDIN